MYGSPRRVSSTTLFRMNYDMAHLGDGSVEDMEWMELDEEDEDETPTVAAAPPRGPAPPVSTKRLKHPLVRCREEVALWIHDECHGALAAQARAEFSLPPETFARAAWRRQIATEGTVTDVDMKTKRQLYAMMRDPAITPGVFIPSIGITFGQLCVFQILTKTDAEKVRLCDLVDACQLVNPVMQQQRVAIKVVPHPQSPSNNILRLLKYGHNEKAPKGSGGSAGERKRGRK